MKRPEEIGIEELLAHESWLRGLVRDLVPDAQGADDVLQETWVRALTRPPVRRGSVRAWLARVAKSRARDRWRRDGRARRREAAVARAEVEPAGSEPAIDAEVRRSLTRALLSLPEPYRRTLLLRYANGVSAAEIARREHLAPATVRTRVKRGLDLLRSRLSPESPTRGRRALPGVALIMGTKTKLAVAAAAALLLIGGGALLLDSDPPPPLAPEVTPAPTPEPVTVAAPGPVDPPAGRDGSGGAGPAGGRVLREVPPYRPTVTPALAPLAVYLHLCRPVDLPDEVWDPVPERAFARITAETGVAIDVSPDARRVLTGLPGYRLSGIPPWGYLQFVARMWNCPIEVGPDGVRMRMAKRGPRSKETGIAAFTERWRGDSDLVRQLLQPARERIREERRIRERFGSVAELRSLRLMIPARTKIESIDDLRWALVRAAGGELPHRIPEAILARPAAAPVRAGTATEILDAALGEDSDLRAVVTRNGVEVLPLAGASRAEAAEAAAEAACERLIAVRLPEHPSPIGLKALAAATTDATGMQVVVDPEYERYSVEPPASATVAEALNSIRTTFPYVGWTIVADTILILREAPPPDR